MRKEYALMILATFVWGSGHPIGKIILRELTPSQLSFLSVTLGALVLLACLFLTPSRKRISEIRGRAMVLTMASGAIMFFVYPNLSFSALRLIPASANSILVASSTIFVALLAAAILKEKLSGIGYFGIIVSFLGVTLVVISTESNLKMSGLSTVGSLIAMSAAFTSASYAIVGRRMRECDALCVTALGATFGSILQGGMLLGSSSLNQLMHASSITYLLVAYWGAFSALGYVVYYYCLGRMDATKASSFIYLSPLFATALSVAALGEQLTTVFLAGLVLTLGGIWLTQRQNTGWLLLKNPRKSSN